MGELFHGLGAIGLYFVICVVVVLTIRTVTKIPDEPFRKLLHLVLLGSLLMWVVVFDTWYIAALVSMGFAVVVYPILWVLERLPSYSHFVTERKSGELKASLLQVYGMFAAVIAVCWGIFGDKLLVLASVYAWGFGDAAAALVGKKWGRHKVHLGRVDGKKSYEGSTAMLATSLVCVLVILLVRGGPGWPVCLLISVVTALVSTAAELFSRDGHDTIACPLGAMLTLLGLLYCFGGL